MLVLNIQRMYLLPEFQKIEEDACKNCEALERVIIAGSENVIIEEYAFSGCLG